MTAIITGNEEVLSHMLKTISKCENKPFRDILSQNVSKNKTLLTWAFENNYTVLITVSLYMHISPIAHCIYNTIVGNTAT